LIVDDKPENLLSLKKTLELNKLEADTASSGEEALQKVLQRSYALIILDVQMPGMDGFEVAEALTGYSKTKDIPIIFLSAVNIDKKFITRGYASGGIDYVTKPVDPDILLLKVKTFYRLYEQKQELKEIQKNLTDEIAERRKAEQALNTTVDELHSIIESIPQLAFTATPDGEIEFVNNQWFRYAKSASDFPETADAEKPLKQRWLDALADNRAIEMEVRLNDLETGERCYHLLRAFPVRDSNGSIIKWVGTITDINVQKQLNRVLEEKVHERTGELKKTNKELEARNYELQQFASVASHDLKEPLRKIQIFSSLVLNKLKANEYDGLEDYLYRIIGSGERMSGLIHDLLVYSKLSGESLFQQTDLNLIISEIVSDLEIAINEKHAIIEAAPLPAIESIPGQMRQLFQNIISNALKFTVDGRQPVIRIEVETVGSKSMDAPQTPEGKYCRISISDNGIGFDEQYLDKIFTLFQRLNSKESFEGTGIGLAIAKKIVEKHSGIITARSQENEGATFIIILPLEQGTETHYVPEITMYTENP